MYNTMLPQPTVGIGALSHAEAAWKAVRKHQQPC